jgi:hypothetical protein
MYSEHVVEQENDLFDDFADLFKKSVNPNEVNSDYKFFYDRLENVRNKKLKGL